MYRGILAAPVRTCLGRAFTLGLILACCWGSIDALAETIQRGYFGLRAYTVILHTFKHGVNASLFASVTILLPAAVVWILGYAALTFIGLPARRADVGAAVWTAVLPAAAAVGYYVNKSDWYPDFFSAAGILANALLIIGSVGVAFGAWAGVGRMRDTIAGWFEHKGTFLGPTGAVAVVAYVAIVNGAFVAVNSRSTATAGVEVAAAIPRVIVMGLDGASWKIIDPLLRRGLLPNIKRLMTTGTYRELETFEPTLSPIIWTTVATGKPMCAHGIQGFTVQRGPDRGKLVTSDMRRVKALWNILGDHDRSVGIVGWFVTWPAETVNGFMVSSYAGAGRIKKGTLNKDIPQLVYPARVIDEIAPAMARAEADLERQFRRVFPRLDIDRLSSSQRNVVADTREVLLTDLMNAASGLDLYRGHRPDFFALYLAGIDVISHRFWKYMYPDDLPSYNVAPEQVEMFADAIDNYVILTDELIGRYLAVIDENTIIIVMSDHGMGPYTPADGDDDRLSGHHHDAPPGILILSGRQIRKGPLRVPASVFDITPTVLHLLDLPLADDMTGLPILAALDQSLLRHHTPEYIRTYENGSRRAPVRSANESEIDDHLKDRLKSLGYL